MEIALWVRWVVVIAGAGTSGVCLWFVIHSVRRLNKRIEEVDAELEAQGGAPLDPYAALAEIYAQQRPGKLGKRKSG